MTGAVPNTGWLNRWVALDDKEFVENSSRSVCGRPDRLRLAAEANAVFARDEAARPVRYRRCPSQKRETCRISRWRGINRGVICSQGASEILSHDSQN